MIGMLSHAATSICMAGIKSGKAYLIGPKSQLVLAGVVGFLNATGEDSKLVGGCQGKKCVSQSAERGKRQIL